ncbi:MAG: DUF1178 family protein [Magnetospirillum sp.]|nr:DUF1178 family protein [Magnetospirillum sp.]
MILYSLQCAKGHVFDEWFANSAEYDSRSAAGTLTCPECGGGDVSKAIMAPRVAKSAGEPAPAPAAPTCMPGGCGACSFAGHD